MNPDSIVSSEVVSVPLVGIAMVFVDYEGMRNPWQIRMVGGL